MQLLIKILILLLAVNSFADISEWNGLSITTSTSINGGPGFSSFNGGTVVSGGVSCSGDMSDGDNESFEAGEGSFCTTDWTEADTDGVVSTYDSTNSHTGSYALKITSDTDNSNNNRIYGDYGSAQADLYQRFYIWFPTMGSGDYAWFHSLGNDNAELNGGVYYLQWANSSGTYQLKIRDVNENPAEYFNLSTGTKYRIETYADYNTSVTLKVWDSSGTAVATSNGAPDYEISTTPGAVDQRYIVFMDYTPDTAGYIFYIDDYKLSTSGWVGAE